MRVKTNKIYSESVGPCPSYTVPAWLTVQQALTYSILNDKKIGINDSLAITID